jgi:O-acetyl-ADP-ribose deacetylase (regulator of RNase III)
MIRYTVTNSAKFNISMRESFNCSVLIENALTAQSDIITFFANPSFLAGSGISGIIHKAAGPRLEAAARPFAPLTPGQAIITPAFNLSAKYVIHTLV